MFQWKATNVIFLNDDVGGKGKYFKARFLQAGLVKYSFGVCELSKETIDKFVQDFVGCPVIINHKEVTNESAKDDRVGTISKVWFDETDGWYWCEGIIFEQEAIDLINQGYSVSCQYEITEYSENKTGALHNGNPYDKTILNGKPEHLAIVKNPRYENAMIAVNALEIDMENKEYKAENGFITLEETDETGKRKVIWIPGNVIKGKVLDRVRSIANNYKSGDETKFDFSHTRVKPTDEQVKLMKETLSEIENNYKFKGVAQVEISSELNKGSLGCCYSPDNTSLISLSPQLYNGNYSQEKYDKGTKEGWNPQGTGDYIKSVLVHEIGHAITCNSQDDKFWNKIDKIRSDYLKNIKKTDVKNPDFVSNYARTNKYEFVAEAFCQGILSKKYGKYTKQVMETMEEHFGKTSQTKIAFNEKETTKEQNDIWVEGYGYGYPMDEETYNEWSEEKQDKAKNNIIEAINAIKETIMFKNLFKKRSKEMEKEELKTLFMECLEDMTARNEAVDKRKLIDEIGGILKGKVDDEIIRTIIKKAEELSYNPSTKDKADNEVEEEEKEEVKEEVKEEKKEDAENKCGKNEDKKDDEEDKKEAKNAMEEQKNKFYAGNNQSSSSTYLSKSKAIELGDRLF